MISLLTPSPLSHLLLAIWRKDRLPLLLTYAVTLGENVCELLYAAAMGLAIDGLLTRSPLSVLPLAFLWTGHLAIGLFRHVYDTKVFTRIYAGVANELVAQQREAGVAGERIVGRVSLSREIVTFFQEEVPGIASAVIRFAGAVLMLALYDAWIGVFAILALLPIGAVNHRFGRWAGRLNGGLNDQLEREPNIVAGRPLPEVRAHFRRLRFWRVAISNAEARTWGALEALTITLTVAALFRLTSNAQATAGTVFAILAYVFAFGEAVGHLPHIVQNVARVRDIGARVATGVN